MKSKRLKEDFVIFTVRKVESGEKDDGLFS